MKVLVVLSLSAAACGGSSTAPAPPDVARSPAAVAELVRDEVVDGGLWFKDGACEQEFGAPQKIVAPRTKTFAQCLRGLPLRASTRRDAMPDVVVLGYSPGFEIEARIVDDRLTWIGWEAVRDGDPVTPTLGAAAFAALRTDAASPGSVTDEPDGYAWLKVCIDATGNITNVDPREASSEQASTALLAAANSWQFRPFDTGNGAVPACSMVRLGAADAIEQLPWPSSRDDKGLYVSPKRMKLLTQDRLIVPDDVDKTELFHSGKHRIVAAVRVCIDIVGKVTEVRTLNASGLPGYDQKILRRAKQWIYAPFLGPNGPTPVCTAVSFIYTQR